MFLRVERISKMDTTSSRKFVELGIDSRVRSPKYFSDVNREQLSLFHSNYAITRIPVERNNAMADRRFILT